MWLPTAEPLGEGRRQGAHGAAPPSTPAAPARKPIYFVLSLFSERTAETGLGRRPRLLQTLPREHKDGGGSPATEGARVSPRPWGQLLTGRQEELLRRRACPCRPHTKAPGHRGGSRLTLWSSPQGPPPCPWPGHTKEGTAACQPRHLWAQRSPEFPAPPGPGLLDTALQSLKPCAPQSSTDPSQHHTALSVLWEKEANSPGSPLPLLNRLPGTQSEVKGSGLVTIATT